eukprot:scaffold4248_cov109-Isochrysis_galbana.AAC.1
MLPTSRCRATFAARRRCGVLSAIASRGPRPPPQLAASHLNPGPLVLLSSIVFAFLLLFLLLFIIRIG